MERETKKVLDQSEEKFRLLFGQNLSQKKYRTLKFMKNTPTSQLLRQTMGSQFLGMTLGGTVGGVVGLIGGPKGAAVGAGSGASMGFIAGTAYAGYQTRKEYKVWIRQYRNDELFTEFLALFDKHSALEEFRCPLTKELMHYPFVDPWGYTYEKEAIEEWVRENKSSPVTQLPLKVSDLRPNYYLMGKQAKTYRDLLARATMGIYLSPIQIEGVGCLLRDLDMQMRHCFFAENKALIELLKLGKISRKAYASQLSLLADYLDG